MVEADLSNLIDSNLTNFKLSCDRHENSTNLSQMIQQLSSELFEFKQADNYKQISPKIIITESDPRKFIAGFIAAIFNDCPIFLCNPNWGNQEKQQVLDLVQPNIIWGNWKYNLKNSKVKNSKELPKLQNTTNIFGQDFPSMDSLPGIPLESSQSFRTETLVSLYPPTNLSPIMIPTGGSSGKIKFAVHTWGTLTASAKGFIKYFGIEQVNSLCVLPLYHVSGLMQFIRCFITGGNLIILPFKQLENSQINSDICNFINPENFFLSLVPTQLQRLLQKPNCHQWLSQFQAILLGGAPAWEELLQKAKYYNIPLAPTYGMTETASQIATLKPDDFLSNKTGCGRVLPHAEININYQTGDKLNTNQIGKINIRSTSLFLGYYSQLEQECVNHQLLDSQLLEHSFSDSKSLEIDDLGFLDEEGYLHIVGRSSEKIITGGENVYPEEIESAIKNTGMITDVCVIGVKDKVWGEVVTAIFIPNTPNIKSDGYSNHVQHQLVTNLKNQLKNRISNYKIPKKWIVVSSLPRNLQGKINRQELNKIVQEFIL